MSLIYYSFSINDSSHIGGTRYICILCVFCSGRKVPAGLALTIDISSARIIPFIQPSVYNRHIVIPLSKEKVARLWITQMMAVHKLDRTCIEPAIPGPKIHLEQILLFLAVAAESLMNALRKMPYLFDTTAPS